jgi:hypothetical protein
MIRCRCGHPQDVHHTMGVAGTGRVTGMCEACTCSGFTPGLRHPRRVAPPLPARPAAPRPADTLILAWDSWWCETCSARTWVEGARCHDELMTAVRLEMHSREPG